MRAIVKVASILGSATALNIVIGLFRGKYLAFQLGPEGLGIVSQVIMLSTFLTSICTLNMSTGLIKYISEYWAKNNINKINQIVGCSCILLIPLSLVMALVVLVFSKQLSQFIFASEAYSYPLYFVAFALPFVVFGSEIFKSVFYGFHKISEYARALIFTSIASFLLLLVFVYYLNIKGVFIHFYAASISSFIIFYLFLPRSIPVEFNINAANLRALKDRVILSKLFSYSVVIAVNGMIGTFVLLHLRSLLIKELGAEANGYYQIAFALSGYYLPFLTSSLWAYFYPRMSSLKNRDDYSFEINSYIRFCALGLTPVVVILTTFKLLLIRLMFTSDFTPASQLIALQGAGDLFFLIFYTLNTSLLARARFKIFLFIATIGYNAVIYIVFFNALYVFDLNIKSLNVAYLTAAAIFALINLLYHKRDIELTLSTQNLKLIFASLLLITLIAVIPDYHLLIPIKLCLLLGWCVFAFTKAEMKKIKEALIRRCKFLQPLSGGAA